MFGGPARGSSQFIVTKRAGMSQFEAVAPAAKHARKRESATSVFRQKRLSDRIFLPAKNGGSSRDFFSCSSTEKYGAENRLPHWIGALVESAVPLEVFRMVPLWSVKKDRWPLEPGDAGVAVIE